jgi:ATP-dependent Lon protease
LCEEAQQKIVDIQETVDEQSMSISSNVPLRFRIMLSGMPIKTKCIAMELLEKLDSIPTSSNEHSKLQSYLSALSKVPFGVYNGLPIDKGDTRAIKTFIQNTTELMNTQIFGHKDAKDQIIRLLAQWISNPNSKGLIIGIHGAMGTGKTTLVKDAICKVLNIPFALVQLGGISDGSYLFGHSYTYEGSMWGKMVDVLMMSGCMNPLIFFDELDKISETKHGDEIVNYLIHLTDQSQNSKMFDKYFSNIEFDFSRSLIIFSYNNEESINPILRDRMICIKTNGYTKTEKIQIAIKHLIPDILAEFNFNKESIVMDTETVAFLVDYIEKEEGVRNLRRALYHIISNVNLSIILDKESFPVKIKQSHIETFVKRSNNDKHRSFHSMYV